MFDKQNGQHLKWLLLISKMRNLANDVSHDWSILTAKIFGATTTRQLDNSTISHISIWLYQSNDYQLNSLISYYLPRWRKFQLPLIPTIILPNMFVFTVYWMPSVNPQLKKFYLSCLMSDIIFQLLVIPMAVNSKQKKTVMAKCGKTSVGISVNWIFFTNYLPWLCSSSKLILRYLWRGAK